MTTEAGKKKATTREKNLCGKTRDIQNPYQIWLAGDWEWRVLKKYQTPSKEAQNQHARWFCAVKSPMTMGSYDLGDVYVSEIKRVATLSLDDLKETGNA